MLFFPPEGREHTVPLLPACAAQVAGGLLALMLALTFQSLWQIPLLFAAAQGLAAAGIAALQRAPRWWLVIHLGFVPLIVAARMLELPSWIWPAGFLSLLLVFWRTDRSRVPLYLTNATASAAVGALLRPTPCRVLDLGCGDGGLLLRLARTRPDCHFIGFEHAPLTWAWARLRCRGLRNIEIRYGDFWSHSLHGYALVYAFLSPVPMERLWHKAQREMDRDAQLISNSFEIPTISPLRVIEVADQRQTRLYCYRPAG